MSKITIADFFCGVGGIGSGFTQANDNYKVVFANDIDKFCKQTYDYNHPDGPELTLEDIHKLTKKMDTIPDFDIFCGGFPCQAFSIAGKQEGFNDKRGMVFFDIIKILKYKKPVCIFLENVKNLTTHDKKLTFEIIQKELKNLGYILFHKVLNSCKYGNIPQNRERIYIIGFLRFDADFVFPDMVPLTKTIADCLEDSVDEKLYYTESDNIYEKIVSDITKPNTIYQFRRHYVRENKTNVCPTLTANMGTGGHNVPIICDDKGIRKLSPRECFNFQGYPSSFKIPPTLSNAQAYKQAGNSVTVPVIKILANEIYDLIK